MDAILLAAGKSERLNHVQAKQLIRLGGKPILVFSLEKMLERPEITRILLVIPDGDEPIYYNILSEYNLKKVICVKGGKTRQKSVFNALEKVISKKVLIHEAARPLISNALLDRVFSFPNEVAVVPVIEIPFTVSIGSDYMEEELDRSCLRNIQLPQLFETQILKKAHIAAKENKISATEDSLLVFRIGEKVKFIPGEIENIKITWPVDLLWAETYLFKEWKF